MAIEQKKGGKRLGILIGGSGLIGGTLMHYFKTKAADDFDLLAPNSKRLSLREPEDISRYLGNNRPDFIINCAIASIDSESKLAYEVNYQGAINLARAALALGIPYIHFSSAAVLPSGEDLKEDDNLPLDVELSNYAKSKLMAEFTLRHMHEQCGLDYTCIRLGVVYGEHDHKIQGFCRLLYSVADQAMPFLLTRRGVAHSYSNAAKLPFFVRHLLDNRDEFSGQTYHFVDPEPVELVELILTIKAFLELKTPREIFMPYRMARVCRSVLRRTLDLMRRVGIRALEPKELIFLENFYETQVLSTTKLAASSFADPAPETSVYSSIPDLINYYLPRWQQLNMISAFKNEFLDSDHRVDAFVRMPGLLLEEINGESVQPLNGIGGCRDMDKN